MSIDFDTWSELGYCFGVKQVEIYNTVYERQFSVSEKECFGIWFEIGLENLKNTNMFLNFSHLLMLIYLCFEGSSGPYNLLERVLETII